MLRIADLSYKAPVPVNSLGRPAREPNRPTEVGHPKTASGASSRTGRPNLAFDDRQALFEAR